MESSRLVGSGLGQQLPHHCLLFGLDISRRPGQRLGQLDCRLTISTPKFLLPWDGSSSSQHRAAAENRMAEDSGHRNS